MYIDNPDVFSIISCAFSEKNETKLHESNTDFILEYVLSGTENVESPDIMICAGSGSLIVVPPDEECVIYHSSENFSAIRVETNGTLFKGILESLGNNGSTSKYTDCHEKFFKILSLYEQYNANDNNIEEELCTLIFSILLSAYAPAKQFDGKLSAEKIKSYILLKMFDDIDLDELADRFGVTKIHIIRVFKEKFDMSPMQFLKEERLIYSEKLLRTSNIPIKNIAALMNYSGTQHFTNLFRERFGTSPGKYRNNSKVN